MTVQWSVALRNAILDQVTTSLGGSWKLKIRSGAQPADVATASSGTVIATFTPTATAAASGAKAYVTGSPTASAAAANAGGSMHYELTTSGDVPVERGTVTVTGGGGDMTIDNMTIALNQTITITQFQKTAPGA